MPSMDVATKGFFLYIPFRVSSCGDLAPKWRFLRPSGARLLVAIRHLKSGDFGKLVETPKKVAFSEPN